MTLLFPPPRLYPARMFLDEVRIEVAGGHGGRGCVSWRREKFVPKGGPDGGDGGRGGNVVILADPNADTLSDFAMKKKFEAPKGRFGMGQNKHGKNAEDLVLRVPPGTVVINEESGDVLADLTEAGTQIVAARGGRGGYGNAHFTSSVRQAPDFAELGEPGERKKLKLELKLVADVGIIGFPSVGKSTLISVISSAKPKIAEYEFTTLVPNLGVVTVHDRQFVVCDIPGLIEGASEGKGLGDAFLKHIERCGILLHLLDVNRKDLVEDYRVIRKELEKYSPTLAQKRELVVLNKIDLVQDDPALWASELKEAGIDVAASISSATTHGVDALLSQLLPIVLEEREKRAIQKPSSGGEDIAVLKPHLLSERMGAYRIMPKEGGFLVEGKRLQQLTTMTDFRSRGAIQRFRDVVDRIGLRKALERMGADAESSVMIGDTDVSEFWR